jgi:hypothetical protein
MSENKNQIKNIIEKSWREYQNNSIGMEENEHWAHEHGWKDGYEWILSELLLDRKISQKDFKKYMNYLYEY